MALSRPQKYIYSKRLDIYSLIGWIIEEKDSESTEYIRIILEIIKFYNSISAFEINREFGLSEKIIVRLLNSIIKTYPGLLDFEEKNNNIYYSISDEEKLSNFETLHEKLERKISFGLCSSPILYINRFIKIDNSLKYSPEKENYIILKTLNKILSIAKKEINNYYTVNSDNIKLMLEKGIIIKGKSIGKLIFNSKNNFDIEISNLTLHDTLTSMHPDYSSLLNELSQIKKQEKQIKNKINKIILSLTKNITFELDLELDYGKVFISINESDMDKIGIIMNLLKSHDKESILIDLKNNWEANFEIEIAILNDELQNKVEFVNSLISDIEENYEDIFKKNSTQILEYINQFWQDLYPKSANTWSEDDFLGLLAILYNQKYSEWLNHIYGIFLEEIIFE